MKFFRNSARDLTRFLRRLGSGTTRDSLSRAVPSGDTDLADRERLIQRILSTIHNNSILLCGDPSFCKTSMLLELEKRLSAGEDSATEFFPVYIDLHGVPERLLFATVADAVLGQLAFAPPTKVERFGSDYGHRDLASDFRKVVRTLNESCTKQTRLVLLIDGIDELNNYHQRTAQRVRSLFMTSLDGNLVMVATAVQIDKRWEQEGSPWYNFFEEIELPSADPEPKRSG